VTPEEVDVRVAEQLRGLRIETTITQESDGLYFHTKLYASGQVVSEDSVALIKHTPEHGQEKQASGDNSDPGFWSKK
jgi:hypothetical protein